MCFPIGHARRSGQASRNLLDEYREESLENSPMAHKSWLIKPVLIFLVMALFMLWESGRDASYIRLPLFEDSEVFMTLSQASLRAVDCIKSVAYLQPHFFEHVNTERLLNAVELQHDLQCVVERGVFRRASARDMRPTERSYVWFRDPDCLGTRSRELAAIPTSQICQHLRGKRLLLIGDRTQYSLHNLILHRLGVDQENVHRLCAGPELCNWHQICLQPVHPITGITSLDSNSSSLPYDDPIQHPVSPLEKHLIPVNWSHIGIMRYAQSTTLLSTSKRSDRRLNDPYLSSSTSIRENESFWRFWVMGSDIIVLSKGPVPAPAWSWKGSSLGTSDMSGFALRPVRDHVFSHEFDNFTMPSGRTLTNSRLPSNVHEYTAADITEAATRATIEVWLPATLRTLSTLRNDPDGTLRKKVIVWRGEWFAQSRCNQPSTRRRKRLGSVLGLRVRAKSVYVADPWLAFHNLQGT